MVIEGVFVVGVAQPHLMAAFNRYFPATQFRQKTFVNSE